MTSITKLEIDKLLRECTDKKTTARTYTRLLGLRQLSLSKCESGPQKYAGIVQEFHNATKEEVLYAARYKSRKGLQKAIHDQEFIPSCFNQCLEKYGPKIWNNGDDGTYVTVLDESYPRHLIFEDAEDRELISVYLFCWIIQRTCSKLDKEERGSRKTARGEADETFIPDRIDNNRCASSDLDTAAILPQDQSKSSSRFRAPEATMVPNAMGTTAFPRSNGQPLTPLDDGAHQNILCFARDPRIRLSDATKGHSESSDNPSVGLTDCINVTTPPVSPQSRKRRCSTIDQTENTSFSSLHKTNNLRSGRGMKRKGSSSGQSRPYLPSVRVTIQEMEGVERQQTPSATHLVEERTTSGAITTALEHEDFDADSVQGGSTEPVVVDDTVAATVTQGTHPSLIVKLKLRHTKASQLRLDRKRLALWLLTCLRIDIQPPVSFTDTLALIRSLWTADSLRLRQTLGDAFPPYKEVLDHWLEVLDILLKFWDTTGFRGDRQAWKLHFATLQGAPRNTARVQLLKAGIAMDEWISRQPQGFTICNFSGDVTDVLFSMADWVGSMDDEDKHAFKEQTTQLNESLLGWFSDGK